jgi:hypothetical protein
MAKKQVATHRTIEDFLQGKSQHTIGLFHHFIQQFQTIGKVQVLPAKTMIGIATSRKRIAYVTQLGKDFVHVVFSFEVPHTENLCFQKIAQVPGDVKQYNHHLRLLSKEDVNHEVISFMKLAWDEGS